MSKGLDFTKQIEETTKLHQLASVEAKKIAKLFKGKPVRASLIILNKVEDIIKEKAIF